MRIRKYGLAVGVFAVALLVPTTADATHAWANYHWARTTNPARLDVGDNTSAVWSGHLGVAVTDWDVSEVLDVRLAAGQSTGRCKATSGRIEVCNGTYGYNGWLGLASISVSGDHINAGTVKLNDTYFSAAPYNTPEWRQMVVCQEVGHDFGLDHQDVQFANANLDSCMDYTDSPASNQHPNAHDYEQLTTIYTHLDAAPTGGGCPPKKPGCTSGATNSPSASAGDWGRVVHSQGRTAVYERDLGNGNRVVTFVIWAS